VSLSEFSIIERYFYKDKFENSQTRLGIGDDCALLAVPEGYELAVTTDTMVEGIHFFPDVAPEALAHKLLAVNLSDLASMGAQPIAVLLNLTLPKVDSEWLKNFSDSFFNLTQYFNVDLVGGDTTKGPLSLSLQAMGLVPVGRALKRSNARSGDLIYVTGCIGDAGLGLKIQKDEYPYSQECKQILKQFNQPMPRINEGLKLRDYASSCIDISDGLLADLGHILKASGLGARIDWELIPLSNQVEKYIDETTDWQMPLNAGDDYELCFTVSPEKTELIDIECHEIGVIESSQTFHLYKNGQRQEIGKHGFKHFY